MMIQINAYLKFKDYIKDKIREDLYELETQRTALQSWLESDFITKEDYEKRIQDINYCVLIIKNHLEKMEELPNE